MKRLIKRLSCTLMCLCGTAVGITPASAQNLYGISFFGNEIIEINQETGFATSAAKLNEPISPYGIAVNEGKLYSFEPATDQIVALDIHTGMTSHRFDLGISDTQGEGDLAFRSDGVGFLASALDDEGNPVNELYSFDLANGTSTLIGTTECSIDAMAFDGDNTLYALGQGEGALFTVDPNTAEMTSVGSLSVSQNSPFAAMTFSPEGILYAVIDDRLHIIDTTSGTAQPVDEDTLDLNFSSVSGLAFFDPPIQSQIVVSTMEDVVDPEDGQVSLREAIMMANDTPGEDIIVLPEGTFTLSLAGDDEDSNMNGDLVLMDDTIIWGAGKENTIIDAGGMEGLNNRVLYVANDTSVSLHELTITGGVAEDGGGIYNDGGELHLRDVCVINNIANGEAGSGGGIYNNTGGRLTIMDSEIRENQANRAGGGIEDNAGEMGSVMLRDVNLDANNAGVEPAMAAPGSGGGFHMTGPGNATFIRGSVNNNVAASEGGGLWNGTGTMVIDLVILEGNVASGDGADQGGGGVFNAGGMVTIQNLTVIANNVADGASGSGGGIFNDAGGTMDISRALILKNTANRAGGGIEDNAGESGGLTLSNVNLDWNNAGMEPAIAAPGNGGGLHITGPGNVTITGGTNNDNSAAAEGGGLWNGNGLMVLERTEVEMNRASGDGPDQGGGGVFNAGGSVMISSMSTISNNIADGTAGSGGGILNDAGGTLEVVDSMIINNRANRAGGGIEDNAGADGEVILTNVTLDHNNTGVFPAIAAPGNGGGFHITGPGKATITGGTANGNVAASEGGGLWNGTGAMSIKGTTIDGNIASGDGADQGGGGVFNAGGMVTIQNMSVISNNIADGMAGSGGGILNDAGGTLEVMESMITDNIANRAGGGIEDNSGEMGELILTEVNLNRNNTGAFPAVASPGNGGGLHITGPGNATITGGTANENVAAAEGGGLWNGTGAMTIDGTTIHENIASGDAPDQGGGGIFNAGGMVTVTNSSIISNNVADGAAGSGGGIFNDAGGTVDVTTTLITRNIANRAGGGIEDNSGEMGGLILTDVNLDFNNTGVAPAVASPGNGGGLHITGPGNATITGGWANGNVAASEGGGLWNGSGTMTVTGTNVHGNVAHGDAADNGGGGIFNNGGTLIVEEAMISANIAEGMAGSGGGVFSTAGSVSLTDTTLMANIANRAGGGIELIDGTLSLMGVTLGGPNAEDGNVAGPIGTASPGNGGGIHITGIADTVIDGGAVWNNHAAREGGGLWNQTNSLMTVRNGTVIDSNSASGPASDDGGGGIFNNGGAVVVDGSASVVTLSNNTAEGENARGSAILSVGGTVSLDATTADSDVAVMQMATLHGEAMIAGNLLVDSGSTLAPGFSAGVIESGNAMLMGGSLFHVELGGMMPGENGSDQLRVTGMVDLNGVTLGAMTIDGYVPSIGDAFVIIDNDGDDAVSGMFMNLPEGATTYISGLAASVSYMGGDGNDVVLTIQEGDAYSDFLMENFSEEDLNDPDKEDTVWGINADPDGDGKPNAFEFVDGSDPNVYDLDPFVMLDMVEMDMDVFATYSIMKMAELGDVMIEAHVSDMRDGDFVPTSKEPMTTPEGDDHEWLTFEDDTEVTNEAPRFGKVVVTIGGMTAESETFGISSMPVKPHTAETVGTLTFGALRFVEQMNGHGVVTGSEMEMLMDELADWPEDLAMSAARYVMITSGPNAGIMADIVSNTSDTLTLSDDLSAFDIVGESYEIRSHTTINSGFGMNNEAGLAVGANSMEADNILLVRRGGAQQTIFFSDMDEAWWDGDFEEAGDVIIAPEQGFVIRRKLAEELHLIQQGAVLRGPKVAPIEQDFNLVGTIKANTHLTLDMLGLYTGDPETGLAAGQNPLDADNILVINIDGSTSLYFPFGSGMDAEWRDAAYDPAGDVMIPVGTSFYVRRRAENGEAFNWTIPGE